MLSISQSFTKLSTKSCDLCPLVPDFVLFWREPKMKLLYFRVHQLSRSARLSWWNCCDSLSEQTRNAFTNISLNQMESLIIHFTQQYFHLIRHCSYYVLWRLYAQSLSLTKYNDVPPRMVISHFHRHRYYCVFHLNS